MNTISTTFPALTTTWTLAAATWDSDITNPYIQITVPLGPTVAFYWDNTIDLSAFAVQDKTFFPSRLGAQEPGLHICGPVAADWNSSAGLEVLDIITSVPIGKGVLKDALLARIFPGMPDFPLDNQFIMMGKYSAYAADANLSYPGLLVPVKEANFGSGQPTAAEKLFCYRMIIPRSGGAPPIDQATLEVPGTRYEITGEGIEEDELNYIYRLRRSYEQKQ